MIRELTTKVNRNYFFQGGLDPTQHPAYTQQAPVTLSPGKIFFFAILKYSKYWTSKSYSFVKYVTSNQFHWRLLLRYLLHFEILILTFFQKLMLTSFF